MKRFVIAAAMSLWVVSLPSVSSADTLIMRDGTRIEGTVLNIAARTITFRHADGVSRRYTTSDVKGVEFVSADRANPRAANSSRLEAPVGTELVVRTVETIDSRNVSADQAFSAVVEQDIADRSGRVIVPARSSAQLVIRQLSPSGATGSPEMVLDIQSITVSGRRYLVGRTDLTPGSDSVTGRHTRTAESIGGGAVLGTIVGGIAGAEILTRGRDVHVPAETVLRFRLDAPVTLQPER